MALMDSFLFFVQLSCYLFLLGQDTNVASGRIYYVTVSKTCNSTQITIHPLTPPLISKVAAYTQIAYA